jgi:hypothetical protein
MELFSVFSNNDTNINKEESQSPSAYHAIGGRPVYTVSLVRIHKK